jgi:PPK2 family polyphosphate:nucleotide phosphotransferase
MAKKGRARGKKNDFLKTIRKLVKRYRVTDGKRFRLRDVDPADTADLAPEEKDDAVALLEQGREWLATEQDKLWAQDSQSLLLVFQAMDAAGKDGTIKHVMSGMNPQGCQVATFKQPSAEELDHDYLWRIVRHLPERGRIGVFNRSHYEEVLVVRVHPEILASQRLPEDCVHEGMFRDRLHDIRGFERHLHHNGTRVLKFFLHVSRREQRERFLARLDEPSKNWKFSLSDVKEREHWKKYMEAYEDAIRATATEEAPWVVVPADHKWFTRLVVAGAVADALERMKVRYPEVDEKQRTQLAEARRLLRAEK